MNKKLTEYQIKVYSKAQDALYTLRESVSTTTENELVNPLLDWLRGQLGK